MVHPRKNTRMAAGLALAMLTMTSSTDNHNNLPGVTIVSAAQYVPEYGQHHAPREQDYYPPPPQPKQQYSASKEKGGGAYPYPPHDHHYHPHKKDVSWSSIHRVDQRLGALEDYIKFLQKKSENGEIVAQEAEENMKKMLEALKDELQRLAEETKARTKTATDVLELTKEALVELDKLQENQLTEYEALENYRVKTLPEKVDEIAKKIAEVRQALNTEILALEEKVVQDDVDLRTSAASITRQNERLVAIETDFAMQTHRIAELDNQRLAIEATWIRKVNALESRMDATREDVTAAWNAKWDIVNSARLELTTGVNKVNGDIADLGDVASSLLASTTELSNTQHEVVANIREIQGKISNVDSTMHALEKMHLSGVRPSMERTAENIAMENRVITESLEHLLTQSQKFLNEATQLLVEPPAASETKI